MFAQLISLLLFLCVVHIDCFYPRTDSVSYYRNICQHMKPEDMVQYVSSFKDYTIISDNDKNKDLELFMLKNNLQTYYFSLNNLLNKKEVLDYLLKKYKKTDLRAHSNMYNHRILNTWALGHLEWGDMMAESKSKNLASRQLVDQLLTRHI